MNNQYQRQESFSELTEVPKRITDTLVERLAAVKVKRTEVIDTLAQFYLKTQMHFSTAADFALVVNALYDSLARLQTPAPEDKKAHAAYTVTVRKHYAIAQEADVAYTGLDAASAKELHQRVNAALVAQEPLKELRGTMGRFRAQRDRDTGRHSGPRDVYRAKSTSGWITAPANSD